MEWRRLPGRGRPYRVYREGYRTRTYATYQAAQRGAERMWLAGPVGDMAPVLVIYGSGSDWRIVGMRTADGWRGEDFWVARGGGGP